MQIEFYLIIGILIGGIIGYLLALVKQKNASTTNQSINVAELESNYVSKSIYNSAHSQLVEKEKMHQNTILQKDLTSQRLLGAKEDQLRALTAQYSTVEEQNKQLAQKIEQHKKELTDLQVQFKLEFKNLANEILDEKSKRFIEINEKQVGDLLNPLKDKINTFEKKVNDTYNEENRERASLRQELKQIVELNSRLSDDANKLTSALKGDKKLQGDWGETQLELILEKAGLQKDIHYLKQPNYKDEDEKNVRPDYVINLPEEKHLILDSKVSLVAYEGYYNCESDDEKSLFLKTHLQNINKHIIDLSSKKYQNIYDINSPDYVLLFVPIEPALTLALREDVALFEKALARNIVLVSTSTLLATLRTISHIWKQEDQRNNVKDIARIGGALYDKFVAFTEDMLKVGKSMDSAKEAHSLAMNKLFESKRKGDTILGRVEQLKNLGANTTKQISQKMLDKIDE